MRDITLNATAQARIAEQRATDKRRALRKYASAEKQFNKSAQAAAAAYARAKKRAYTTYEKRITRAMDVRKRALSQTV